MDTITLAVINTNNFSYDDVQVHKPGCNHIKRMNRHVAYLDGYEVTVYRDHAMHAIWSDYNSDFIEEDSESGNDHTFWIAYMTCTGLVEKKTYYDGR